ncbi:MAG: DUF6868 family protein [Boseongicola sp.]
MSVEFLTQLFGWMTLINIGILVISSVFMMLFRNAGTTLHARMFGIDPDRAVEVWYSYLGSFKVALIVLNLTPYLALRFFI